MAVDVQWKQFTYLLLSCLLGMLLTAPWQQYADFKSRNSLSLKTSQGGSIGLPHDMLESEPTVVSDQEIRGRRLREVGDNCWSRSEMFASPERYLPLMNSSDAFKDRFREYVEHHRSCIAAAKNWTAVILGDTKPVDVRNGEECKFLFLELSSFGLGNQLQSNIAAFAFSLLTNRVFLTSSWQMTAMLCQPFAGSDWNLDPWYFYFIRDHSQNLTPDFCLTEEVWDEKKTIPRASVRIQFEGKVADHNFFCEESQKRLAQMPWLTLTTEQYFVPALYLVPSFRKQLEMLFPDFKPFTHIARVLVLPSNFMWERITRLYAMHFEHAETRVGVQVRTFLDEDRYAHRRVLGCLINVSQAVPPPVLPKVWSDIFFQAVKDKDVVDKVVGEKNPKRILMFVTTLHSHHITFLYDLYMEGVAVDGSYVNVHSYPASGEESHDKANDRRAFAEMILLSFSHTLLTSHFSTFGYIASGLSGKQSYLMNIVSEGAHVYAEPFQRNGRPLCELSVSSEPCFHSAPHTRQCNITAGEPQSTDEIPPYIQRCQDASFGYRVDPSLANLAG